MKGKTSKAAAGRKGGASRPSLKKSSKKKAPKK